MRVSKKYDARNTVRCVNCGVVGQAVSIGDKALIGLKMIQNDVDKYNIEPCKCGESEALQVLPKFNRKQVHCVNCGNQSFAMLTAELAVEAWNETNRF